jgi:hypothetical protein
MREAVSKNRVERTLSTGSRYAEGWHQELIAQHSFALNQIRQSYNSADAVQTLHYLDRTKVNRQVFFAALEKALEEVSRG